MNRVREKTLCSLLEYLHSVRADPAERVVKQAIPSPEPSPTVSSTNRGTIGNWHSTRT